MTIGGALSELNNLLKADDIPFYYKPSIKAVMDTIALSNLENPSKWIPVSEKLPEERKAVLVYAPEYKNIYCAYLDGDTWFIFGGYGSYAVANVLAWMPLPKPYEPQERSE